MDTLSKIAPYREGGKTTMRRFWQRGLDHNVCRSYEVLEEYFLSKESETVTDDELKKVSIPKIDKSVTYAGEYETETENNSYACTGASMYNQFCYSVNKDGKEFINQKDVRAFAPKKFTSLEDLQKQGHKIDKAEYKKMVEKAKNYMGKKKKERGNIFEIGDFFLSKRKDIQLKSMKINTPEFKFSYTDEEEDKNDLVTNNQMAAFSKQVEEILNTGNVVGVVIHNNMSMGGRYYTITGIDTRSSDRYEHMIRVIDTDPEAESQEYSKHISDFFFKMLGGNVVELNWLEKLEKPQEMTKKYSNLNYTKKNGYSAKKKPNEPALDLVQHDGVCFKVENSELPKEMRGIGIEMSVYVPKQASVN